MNIKDESLIRRLIKDLDQLEYIVPEDVPGIDLYMDQVTTFMDENLKGSKRHDGDKLLTKTMINNYTKNKLLPPPEKKKYSKEHMYLLVFIYYFKNILSISDIQSIFNPLTDKYFSNEEGFSLEDIYKEIYDLEFEQTPSIIKDLIRKKNKAKASFPEIEDDKEKEFLTNFSFISMLCFDIYIKKRMIEKIIDKSMTHTDKKEKDHKKKEKN